MIDIQGELYR